MPIIIPSGYLLFYCPRTRNTCPGTKHLADSE